MFFKLEMLERLRNLDDEKSYVDRCVKIYEDYCQKVV